MKKSTTKSTTRTITTTTKRVTRRVSRKPATIERIREVFESGILNGLDNANSRLIAIYLLATGQSILEATHYETAAACGIWPSNAKRHLKSLADSCTLSEILG